jgi:hypothetical protein
VSDLGFRCCCRFGYPNRLRFKANKSSEILELIRVLFTRDRAKSDMRKARA